MTVRLINPSHLSFGMAVITPRWLYVLAAATPASCGDPTLTDETLEQTDFSQIRVGDVVGIGIHTGNALRGYEVGLAARARGATVVFGGIHATLYPEEAFGRGGAHAVVKGDGDVVWATVLADCAAGSPKAFYDGGRVPGPALRSARWNLLPHNRYMWASVQTVRGCPKHCSFCSVWRTDGQDRRQRGTEAVVSEVVELRRRGFRFIALADDNFYPVTLNDLALAARRDDGVGLRELEVLRSERFEMMARLAKLPSDTVFFTQITMEAAEDPAFLDAMRRAHIKGALVGVESATPEGLKSVHKGFNLSGKDLVRRLKAFREHGVHVLGSFIFGLPGDRPNSFEATGALAHEAQLTFAQFLTLTPFPGTTDFMQWEESLAAESSDAGAVPPAHYWLNPAARPLHAFSRHPQMSADEIRQRTQEAWDSFYSLRRIWERSDCVRSLRARMAFVLVSKLYRQMYANTGLTTDSARVNRSARWARWLARPCRRLFAGRPMPYLKIPAAEPGPMDCSFPRGGSGTLPCRRTEPSLDFPPPLTGESGL
jgi:radical SAM superfamily enzyme YgiQ (UPF0313 family)